MAVLSSRNGKFYEVPDADLKKYELPADKVKEVLAGMDNEAGPGGVEPYSHGGPAQVIIHVSGSGATVDAGPPEGEGGRVEPYGWGGWGPGHGYGWGHYPYWGWRRRRFYYGGY